MQAGIRSGVVGWGLALALPLALFATLPRDTHFHGVLYLFAVVIVAAAGGVVPGLIATTLAVAVLVAEDAPNLGSPTASDIADVVGLAVFPVLALAATAVLERRRRALETASRVEEKYHALVEGLDAVVWEAENGRLTFVSSQIEALTGFPRERWIQTGLQTERMHPDDRERVQAIVERAETRGERAEIAYRMLRADDTTVWVRSTFSGQVDADGVRRLRGVTIDITESRRLEEQVNQSQKMDAVGRLAGGLAHDLNNMLTAVIGFAELARMDLAQGNSPSQSLEEICTAAERSSTLVQRLLVFSRRDVPLARPIHLNKTIETLLGMISRLIGSDIVVEVDLCTPDPVILADPGQVDQIVVNLAVNARDAMPRGGTIAIATRLVELGEAEAPLHGNVEPGRYAVLSVTDTGSGMDEATQRQIFEPFFTTKAPGEGTGLGLSTVFGIVEQVAGTISVYSVLEHGTTFRAYLPVIADVPAATPPRRRPAPERHTGRRVLFVDDERAIRELARRVLAEHGYAVTTAGDPDEALAAAREQSEPFDLVITDIVMPGMTGSELADALAEHSPDTRVLFVSGYAGETVVERTGGKREIDFLAKPFTFDELLEAVHRSLSDPR
jgi:two-component system, cell cycle sensor histidine kinase and response regulator CckA